MKKISAIMILTMTFLSSYAQLKLTFPAKDGLTVTGDWYPVSSDLPVILLCHQNHFSRGEFKETANRLNTFGFNCFAVDLRVGEEVNGVKNETAIAAKEKHLTPTMEDAEQDMIAAVDYLNDKYKRQVIILGSSYSASLALKIAAENQKVSAVIVFSPGEYFKDKKYISSHIQSLIKPVFVTSSKEEADGVTDLMKDINSRIKIQYIPTSKGDHGSKVLWPDMPDNQEYWIALMSFLEKLKTIK